MQVAQPPFPHFPHAIDKLSEMPAVFEVAESHLIWHDAAVPSCCSPPPRAVHEMSTE